MDADTNICAVILNYNDAQTTMKLTESWKNSKDSIERAVELLTGNLPQKGENT